MDENEPRLPPANSSATSSQTEKARAGRWRRIEFMLYWFGEMTKPELAAAEQCGEDVFHKNDLPEYRQAYPDTVDSDHKRAVIKAAGDDPLNFRPNGHYIPDPQGGAEAFLAEMARWGGILAPPVLGPDETSNASNKLNDVVAFLGLVAPTELPRRYINSEMLRQIVQAIPRHKGRRKADGSSLKVGYRSSPLKIEEFWITPHALMNDGFRWAVRCWMERDDRNGPRFGDLVLDRLVWPSAMKRPQRFDRDIVVSDHTEDKDILWREEFPLLLRANPLMTSEERGHIEWLYDMREQRPSAEWDGRKQRKSYHYDFPVAVARMKRAMIPYFLKRYQIEEKARFKKPYQEPMLLVNRSDASAAMPVHMKLPGNGGPDEIFADRLAAVDEAGK